MKSQFSIFKQSEGFTLIELIVVMSIIGILSSAVFLNRQSGEANFALQNSAYKLAQDIKEIREMAMEAREIDCNGEKGSNFGIQFKSSWPTYYVLFVDCDNDYSQGPGEDFRTINLEKGVKISSLSPDSSFSIIFVPPDPKTYIKIEGGSSASVAEITLSLENYPSRQKSVIVNTSGMVEIK